METLRQFAERERAQHIYQKRLEYLYEQRETAVAGGRPTQNGRCCTERAEITRKIYHSPVCGTAKYW